MKDQMIAVVTKAQMDLDRIYEDLKSNKAKNDLKAAMIRLTHLKHTIAEEGEV